ncbi:Hypothetical predicted protein [Mytilus galloprovincialis]|uniref:Immunoglobulin domain-containing protein n=1 Tax=Mytilus galloprovincialis TaxID=29158 RepID=A0A8B6GIU0_MYTGA|nr:Hypothetical predicted protein [Mytilus galloprovincialis]
MYYYNFDRAALRELYIATSDSLANATTTLYTTPGTYLLLNISDLKDSISCEFYSDRTKSRKKIVKAYREYDTNKYEMVTSDKASLAIQAPKKQGHFSKTVQVFELGNAKLNVTERKQLLDAFKMEGSTIDITFTLNVSRPLSDYSDHVDDGFVHYFYEFYLKIKNASIEDDGVYTCTAITPWMDIVVSSIKFLNQTDDNIMYGQEGKNISIVCAALQGHHEDGLSIKQNMITLAESDSNMVTYSFKPTRQNHSKEYECVGKKELEKVRVMLMVYYAPDVQVFATKKNGFNCLANGFPDTYTFNKWEHLSEKGEHVRYLVGSKNGTLHLNNVPHQYQISGRYICSVSNGIPDANGNLLQNDSESLRFIGHPIFASENRNVKVVQLYKPITLSFLLYSEPIVDKLVIVCVAGNYTKNETTQDFRIYETDLIYTHFGQTGTIRGFEITLDFKMISNEYNAYKIWAINVRGGGSFSFKVRAVGTPIFAPEKSHNFEQVGHGQPVVMRFVLYSNLVIEDIWIEVDGTGHIQTKTKDDLNISKKMLRYTAFENRGGNIIRYQIIFETRILRGMEVLKHIVWIKHELGVDFYRFEIKELDYLKTNRNVKMEFIISSSLAASLLIYISVIHICFSVKCRTLRNNKRNLPEDLQYHMYDDIDSVAYQAVNVSRFAIGQQVSSAQIRNAHSSQTSTDNQQTVPVTSELCLTVFEKEIPVNDEHHNGIAVATLDISFSSPEDIRHSGMNHGEEFDTSGDPSQLYPSRRHQDEQSFTNFGKSIDSASSDDSKIKLFDPASDDVFGNDGYENPYQIVTREGQPIHQYMSILNQSEHNDQQISTNFGRSIDSSSSEDTKNKLFDPGSGDFNDNGGYEKTRQVVIQENKPIDQYRSIINQSEHLNSVTQTDVRDYVNLQF